jgi:hypothetical protein
MVTVPNWHFWASCKDQLYMCTVTHITEITSVEFVAMILHCALKQTIFKGKQTNNSGKVYVSTHISFLVIEAPVRYTHMTECYLILFI